MKLSRKPVLISAVLLVLACVVAFSFFILPQLLEDPAKPPALLTAEELGQMKLLFDGETTKGWKIEGPSRIQDGTLELGGEQATTARLEREFNPGDKVQFHFLHERTPGMSMPDDAVMKMELIYVKPDDHKGQQGPPAVELRKSGLTPQGGANRWHKGIVSTELSGDVPKNFQWRVQLYQFLTDKSGGPSSTGSRDTDDGCRFVILFRTAPGNKLLLRNVCVEEASTRSQE